MFRNYVLLAISSLIFISVAGAARMQETPPGGGGSPPTDPHEMLWAYCETYPAPPGGFGGVGRPLHCTSPGPICVNLDDACVVNNVAVVTNKALFAEMGFRTCNVDNSSPMKKCTQSGITTCMAIALFQDDCLNAYICLKARKVIGC
jgi:hypothetical protein